MKKSDHYIDMPIRHGCDTVLKRMGRKSSQELIRQTVKKLRDAMPDIAIRTTLIVGFPGETEEEFADLQKFVEEMRFDRLGVFCYSQEEGTPAAKMENQIDDEVKEERQRIIMEHPEKYCRFPVSAGSGQNTGSIGGRQTAEEMYTRPYPLGCAGH